MTTVPEEAGTLWAVNIHGPDDLIAAPDYLSAVRMANAFNAWWLNLKTKQQHNDAIDARMWAIPTDWPGNDAQGHAVELSKPHPEYQWLRDTLSALEPSAARELALEEVCILIDEFERDFDQKWRNQLKAAIRALSSPDHADAGHAQARDVLARFRDYVIEGITAGTIMRGGEHHNPIWQEVASVLHADAGKVEGDGWLPIESAPKDGTVIDLWSDEYGRLTDCYWGAPMAYEGGETGWVHAHSNEWAESPDEFVHWRPLPSALSEGAE